MIAIARGCRERKRWRSERCRPNSRRRRGWDRCNWYRRRKSNGWGLSSERWSTIRCGGRRDGHRDRRGDGGIQCGRGRRHSDRCNGLRVPRRGGWRRILPTRGRWDGERATLRRRTGRYRQSEVGRQLPKPGDSGCTIGNGSIQLSKVPPDGIDTFGDAVFQSQRDPDRIGVDHLNDPRDAARASQRSRP